MTNPTDKHILNVEDTRYILSAIKETVYIYEYPTPAIFSAVTRCCLINFLKGAGAPTDSLEEVSISLYEQLKQYAGSEPSYQWFIDWSQKLICSVKERKTRD